VPAREPTDEIDITPEMIEAGVDALNLFNPGHEAEEDAVIRIFLAMASVSASLSVKV
jgi:hypothetical protein